MPRHQRGPISPKASLRRDSNRTFNGRKRDRYVLHACNRCRAAKVRCNGETPCSYCRQRDPNSCHYTLLRSPQETEDVDVLANTLRHQNDKLDTILARISALEHNHHRPHASSNTASTSSWNKEPLPLFQSPTSAFFFIHIVNANVGAEELPSMNCCPRNEHNSGPTAASFSIIHDQVVGEATSGVVEGIPEASSVPDSISDRSIYDAHKSSYHALDQLEATEILRLSDKYQDSVGMMYPIVDVSRMQHRAWELWTNGARMDTGIGPSSHLDQDELHTLHLTTAIALVMEHEDDSQLIQTLHDSVWPEVDSMIWTTRVDVKSLVILTLMSLFYYCSHKRRLAWRLIDNITRIILELGLNRQVVLDRTFRDQDRHSQAVNIIWTVFVLERQLSYSLGLSTAVRHFRMDSDFPRPFEAPYLEAMVQYAKIGVQACESLLGENLGHQTATNYQEAYSYCLYRLEEWRKAIETDFQYPSAGQRTERWNKLLRTILHLRANNLHIVVSRFLLFENGAQRATLPGVWDSSVNMAADTSQLLLMIDSVPTTCRFQKSQSNYFLIAALGICLLALLQDPSIHPSAHLVTSSIAMTPTTYLKAKQTAIVFLDLLRRRAESSRQSKGLWEWIRGLAAQLNLLDFLLQPNMFPESEEWAGVIQEPGINEELLMSQANIQKNQHSADIDPIGDVNFSAFAGDSSSLLNMVSGLEMTFDPTSSSLGLG